MTPDTDQLIQLFIERARTNFAAFVSATHRPRFKHSEFSRRTCAAVDKFVDDLVAGKRPVLVLTAPPQHGKELADDTPMLTENKGWITHGELCVGDRVFRPDGTATAVVAVSEPCESDLRLTFSDGSGLETHSRHEWLLHRAWVQGRTARVFETQEIEAKGAWKGDRGQRGSRANFLLPDVLPLRGTAQTLPVHPYALGVWLGDGERTSGRITVSEQDEDIVRGVESAGYPLTNRWRCNQVDTHANFTTLRAALRDAGVLCRGMQDPKRIPDAYFLASVEQRLELLAGLIDSDGYVYPVNGRVTFSNTEPELVRDVQRLVASFGWRVSTSWVEPALSSSGVQGTKPVAQVCFQPDVPIPCRVARYREAFKLDAAKRKRAIVAVERGAFGLGRCIQVEHPDGMYLAGDTLIPTHNSSLISRCLPPYLIGRLGKELGTARIALASYALTRAKANGRDAKNIMLEPTYRAIFPEASLIGFRGDINTSDRYSVPNGQVLATGVGGGMTGFSVDVMLIDDAIKDAVEALSPGNQEKLENWFDSVVTTRLQERSGQVIIGTPWSSNDLLAFVHNKFKDDPNYTRLQFVALNYEDQVGYQPDQAEGPLVPELQSEEKLRAVMAHMGAQWWAAMYQQAPLGSLGAIFGQDGVRYYRRQDLPAQFTQVVISVDAAFKDKKSSDYVAAGVWGKSADGRVWLLEMRREKLSFTRTATAIAGLRAAYPRATRILIEDAANGPALIDQLGKSIQGIKAVPTTGSKESRAHAVSWVWENGQVMLPHPDDVPMIKPVVAEITSFPDTKNDDAVDCMVIALQHLCLRDPISALVTPEMLLSLSRTR